MALCTCIKKAICETANPLIQIKRFRGKINIQKPKPPHFEKAKFLALTKPWFVSTKKDEIPVELCSKSEIPPYKQKSLENKFQEIIAGELHRWFSTSKLIALCHYNPMAKEQEVNAYIMFKKEKMHFKQYGKETLEMAIKGTPYETVLDFYVSRNMLIFSSEPKIKTLLSILKKFPQLVLLAGIYENKLLNKEELIYYSTIPNLQAAQAGLVQTLNSAASQLISNLNSHQTTLVCHLEQRAQQLQEK